MVAMYSVTNFLFSFLPLKNQRLLEKLRRDDRKSERLFSFRKTTHIYYRWRERERQSSTKLVLLKRISIIQLEILKDSQHAFISFHVEQGCSAKKRD